MSLRIAVMASGTGSNLRVILEQAAAGRLNVTPCLVLSNNPQAGALKHAQELGVPVWCHSHTEFSGRAAFDAALLEELGKAGAEAVVLAGYMRLLSREFLHGFKGSVLNIHPALLPSFAGVHGGKDAVEYGVKLSGCTVHLVEEAMDAGPIIIQAAVPLSAGETEEKLMARIHKMEHRIYPQAIHWLAEGRMQVQGRNVRILPDSTGREAPLASCAPAGEEPYMVSPGLEAF